MKAPLIIAILMLASCAKREPCGGDTTAFVMANQFVEKTLRSPSTAEFPSITADGVIVSRLLADKRPCTFSVTTYVDAQNAFGATVRQRYLVQLRPDSTGMNWTLDDIMTLD